MYYITNQTDEIIAADHDFMSLLHVDDIREIYKKVALGEVELLHPSDTELVLTCGDQSSEYKIERSPLRSILGELTIIHLIAADTPKEVIDKEVCETLETENETEEELLPLSLEEETVTNDEILELFGTEENDADSISSPAVDEADDETNVTMDMDEEILDLFGTKEDEETIPPVLTETESTETHGHEKTTEEQTDEHLDISTSDLLLVEGEDTLESLKPTSETEAATDDALYDLILPDEPADTIDEITHPLDTQEASTETTETIVLDIDKISQRIGVSPEEYQTFLNEYIDTAINLEKDLQSTDTDKKNRAIETLSHLADVLYLPKIKNILTNLSSATGEEEQSSITTLYKVLSEITTEANENENTVTEKIEIVSEDVPSEDTEEVNTGKEGFGTIDLSEVKPIHFDFRLEEAADDLSLPVELIEEFVLDFIQQAKEETPKMLEAYEKGELETIQKIGHLLKGAASNLRITPLADTLYEIQFCNDSSQLEPLIKNYWAHFLSFDNQMNIITK